MRGSIDNQCFCPLSRALRARYSRSSSGLELTERARKVFSRVLGDKSDWAGKQTPELDSPGQGTAGQGLSRHQVPVVHRHIGRGRCQGSLDELLTRTVTRRSLGQRARLALSYATPLRDRKNSETLPGKTVSATGRSSSGAHLFAKVINFLLVFSCEVILDVVQEVQVAFGSCDARMA